MVSNPDTIDYTTAAAAIVRHFDYNTEGVAMFGPGYPSFLALQEIIMGIHPIAMLIIQILLSAAGSYFLMQFTLKLTGEKKIAIIAGLLNAFSFTSITLANSLLSDTLFFVLTLVGLILFWRILERGGIVLSVVTGIVFTIVVLTRAIAMLFPLILLLFAGIHFAPLCKQNTKSYLLKLVPALTVVLVVAVCLCAWGYRNYRADGISGVTFSGPYALSRLSCLTESRLHGSDFPICMSSFTQQAKEQAGDSLPWRLVYSRNATSSFKNLLSSHPLAVAATIAINIRDNVHCENEFQYSQVPYWNDTMKRLVRFIYKKGLNYRVSLLSLLGFIILFVSKRRHNAIFLALVWFYFAIFSGLALWQGSRIFYPGQIAWSILSAYSISTILFWLISRIRRRPSANF